MTQHRSLDATDRKLLALLQREATMKRGELAEAVQMSIPSVSERIKRLEAQGIIKGYHTHVEPRKIGLEVTAFITLQVDAPNYPELQERAQAEPQILECHAVTGAGSHFLKVRTPNTVSLERLLAQLQSWPGVQQTRTHVVLSSPKETTILPLSQLEQKE